MNFLVAYFLSLGASVIAKLGLLNFQLKEFNKRGYKIKINNFNDLLILLDLDSLKKILFFIIPGINLFSVVENFVFYENNHDICFKKMLKSGILISKYDKGKSKKDKHIRKSNKDIITKKNNDNTLSKIEILKKYRQELLENKESNIYIKMKKMVLNNKKSDI